SRQGDERRRGRVEFRWISRATVFANHMNQRRHKAAAPGGRARERARWSEVEDRPLPPAFGGALVEEDALIATRSAAIAECPERVRRVAEELIRRPCLRKLEVLELPGRPLHPRRGYIVHELAAANIDGVCEPVRVRAQVGDHASEWIRMPVERRE